MEDLFELLMIIVDLIVALLEGSDDAGKKRAE